MNLNLSASLVACLSANIKVPKQLVYANSTTQEEKHSSPVSSSSNVTESRIVFPDSSTSIENRPHFHNEYQNFTTLQNLSSNETYSSNISSTLPDIIQKQHKNDLIEQRAFKCLTCGKGFRQKATLVQHERIHTNTRPFGCTECGKHFRQQSHLTQHIRIHANEKPYQCLFCDKSFRQRAILNQHQRIHSGEKPFMCIICGKHFRQKAILNQHIRIHQDIGQHLVLKNAESQTIWPVSVVTEMAYSASNAVDSTTTTTTTTSTATATTTTTNTSEGDDAGSIPVRLKVEPIDVTGDELPSSSTESYIKNWESSVNYFKQGHYINPKSINLPDILLHNRTSNNSGVSLFVRCPVCQKEFKQKSTLLQHGCIHIESRPYPCPECDKRFRQQSHLTQHLRIHTNEKPYNCPYCGRQFRQRTILNQHIRIHTGEKPYRCGQCMKEFRQKAILDQHIRTHQGERPFCCPMPSCKRRFINELEVKKHIEHHMNPGNRKRKTTAINNSHPTTINMSINGDGNAICNTLPQTTAAAFFKPDLYFPQCYGAPFIAHSQTESFSNLTNNNTTTVQIISNINDFSKLSSNSTENISNSGRSVS